MYPSQIWQKVWTGGHVINIMKKKFQFPFILLLKSVDMWTRSCLSISCLLSTLYPSKFCQKSVDRWTSNENFWKIVSTYYVLLCKSVDMWTRSCFSISSFLFTLYLQNFDKKVWTGGQVMKNFDKSFVAELLENVIMINTKLNKHMTIITWSNQLPVGSAPVGVLAVYFSTGLRMGSAIMISVLSPSKLSEPHLRNCKSLSSQPESHSY